MRKKWLLGLGAALVVAALLSPFASPNPDGLERVAEDKGFLYKGEGAALLNSPLPDYQIPGVNNPLVSTGAAGVAGTLTVFGLMFGLGKLASRRNRPKSFRVIIRGDSQAKEGEQ